MLELSDYPDGDIAQTVRSTLEPLAADKKLKLIQSTDTPLALIGAAHFSISLLTKCFR